MVQNTYKNMLSSDHMTSGYMFLDYIKAITVEILFKKMVQNAYRNIYIYIFGKVA